MSENYTVENLLDLCEGDREFIEQLFAQGILESPQSITQVELERTRVAWALVQELEVNLAGVDIILRLREEILTTRRQMLEVAESLQDRKESK